MRFRILCEECNDCVVAQYEHDDPRLIEALLIAAHACPPHAAPHKLKFETNELVAGNVHSLHIKCVLEPPCNKTKEMKVRIPSDLVGSMSIAFHSEHEGHPLEMWYDDKKIHPYVSS